MRGEVDLARPPSARSGTSSWVALKTARAGNRPRGFESHALRSHQRLRRSEPLSVINSGPAARRRGVRFCRMVCGSQRRFTEKTRRRISGVYAGQPTSSIRVFLCVELGGGPVPTFRFQCQGAAQESLDGDEPVRRLARDLSLGRGPARGPRISTPGCNSTSRRLSPSGRKSIGVRLGSDASAPPGQKSTSSPSTVECGVPPSGCARQTGGHGR
jgi:hypothetical protein